MIVTKSVSTIANIFADRRRVSSIVNSKLKSVINPWQICNLLVFLRNSFGFKRQFLADFWTEWIVEIFVVQSKYWYFFVSQSNGRKK